MHGNSSAVNPRSSIGDGAVEGLLVGMAAGLIMVAYLVAVSLFLQAGPRAVLNTLAVNLNVEPILVVIGHFALSAFYGLIWGALYRFLPGRLTIPLWVWGLLYGGLLWGASTVLLPAEIDLPALYSGSAHLLFGLSLGWLTAIVAGTQE
jgi:hypothetical protein